MDTRPTPNKYRAGKMQRTLKRELKVRETVEREADETTAGLYLSVSLGILSFRSNLLFLETGNHLSGGSNSIKGGVRSVPFSFGGLDG